MGEDKQLSSTYSVNKKGDKKTMWAWTMFDWANSAYSLVITSAVFPAFYEAITTDKNEVGDVVSDLVYDKYQIRSTSMYSLFIVLGFLVVALLAPILSGIADYSNNKKIFMKFFTYLGAFSCMSLYFFDAENLLGGLVLVALACIGYAGSLVFYDAYLPEIADESAHDKLSAKGYAMGYIGSVLLLIFSLAMISMPETFGLADSGSASRISFVLVGIWWIVFANVTFFGLAKEPKFEKVPTEIMTKGYREIKKVWYELKTQPLLTRYLLAYFFFNAGVLTVMYMAASFAAVEIKQINDDGSIGALDEGKLILTILIIQLVAAVGAYFFSWISRKVGNLKALMIAIVCWAAICVVAYFVEYSTAFFILAGCVGMVMGGIQSLSRSTYSKMLPETLDHASYFSFFEVCQFVSVVLGTLAFGLIYQWTDDLRNSILAVLVFFAVGIFLLRRVQLYVRANNIKNIR